MSDDILFNILFKLQDYKGDDKSKQKFIIDVFDRAVYFMDIKTLHYIKEEINEMVKTLSKRSTEIWDKVKKGIDTHFYHVRKNYELPDSFVFSPQQARSFQFKSRKSVNEIFLRVVPLDIRRELSIVDGSYNPNLYIAYFSKEGFEHKPPKKDIVYVGEVRKQSTGFFRKIRERWGYSGNDHGAMVRMIIKQEITEKEAQTKVDPYFARYNFDKKNLAFLMYSRDTTSEKPESVLIHKIIELSKKKNSRFTVINKQST